MPTKTLNYVMGQIKFYMDIHDYTRQPPDPKKPNLIRYRANVPMNFLRKPIILNFRFDDAAECPYQPKTAADKKWLAEQLQYVDYFSNEPMPTEIKDPFDDTRFIYTPNQTLLTDEQIDYFKKLNPERPNATIFIHGYNVSWGEFGKLLMTRVNPLPESLLPLSYFTPPSSAIQVQYDPPPPHNEALGTSSYYSIDPIDFPARCFRSRDHLHKIYGENIAHLDYGSDDKLNGSGAHNWFLHMEYNLNRAAGFSGFKPYYEKSDPEYTRLIHVAWTGNPKTPLDYIAIEPMAMIAARCLVPVIEQLHHAGIEINIIAHSAGNVVLVQAMELLAKPIIENVFLWQAAIPNTALSPQADKLDKTLFKRWGTKHAYKAAKAIHVLYSANDNVLGPIAINTDANITAQLQQKKRSSSDGTMYAELAAGITTLSKVTDELHTPVALKSIYNLAQLFGVPFDALLFNQSLRNKAYELLYQQHKHMHTRLPLLPTLAQQRDIVRARDPKTYKDLSVFIGLIEAIMHHSVLYFVHNPNNQDKLTALRADLSPEDATKFDELIGHALSQQFGVDTPTKVMAIFQTHSMWHEAFKEVNDHSYFIKKFAEMYIIDHPSESAAALTRGLLDTLVNQHVSHMSQSLQAIPSRYHINEEVIEACIAGPAGEFAIEKTKDLIQRGFHDLAIDGLSSSQDKLAKLLSLPKGFKKQPHNALAATLAGDDLATLLMTVFSIPSLEPQPAMGYTGPDLEDKQTAKLMKKNILFPQDQGNNLTTHADMKNPTPSQIKSLYEHMIINYKPYTYILGRWKT